MGIMPPAQIQIRPARRDDAAGVAALAQQLAQSFPFSRAAFDRSYPELLADEEVSLLVAADATAGANAIGGYLLGFRHLTFFANGPVGWVEEILVLPKTPPPTSANSSSHPSNTHPVHHTPPAPATRWVWQPATWS
jgi:hypothetical protein